MPCELLNESFTHPNSFFVSALKNLNIDLLLDKIKKIMNEKNIFKTIYLPYNKFKIVSQIYDNFQIIERIDQDSNIKLKIFGKKIDIDNILDKIKKWVCIIRWPFFK